jgi:hypothetical protein
MRLPQVRAFLGRMTNTASMRATNYREHAAELREMAAAGGDDRLDRQLLDLAKQYDALAETADAD